MNAPVSSVSLPAPDHQIRDEMGRLVQLRWGGPAAGRAAHRWLLAVDGSAGCLKATAALIRLLQGHAGPDVDLVQVQPWLGKEAAEAALAPRAWEASAAARRALEAAGVRWCLHVRMGPAAEQILAAAEDLDSGGIALGSHGLTALESIVLGSVATEVLHTGRRPVLVVR